MTMQLPSKRFYVYNLTDPHDKIFYVGKGCGPRVHQHEDEARRGHECHKCRKIRKIWKNGGEVRKYIVFETDDEQEAYTHEAELIMSIGLKNLCNVVLGGRGGVSVSNERIAQMRAAIENWEAEIEERKYKEACLRAYWRKRAEWDKKSAKKKVKKK